MKAIESVKAIKPASQAKPEPVPLSDSTKALVALLDKIIADLDNPTTSPAPTINDLFGQHVRTQTAANSAQPLYGEDELKLAYVELIKAMQPQE